MNSKKTKIAFLAGVVYFTAMATAHFFSIKVPILFVYYDTPFYAYQDKIISFAVCAYVALFHAAAKHRAVAPSAITVLALTFFGLSAVNVSPTLTTLLKEGQTTTPYWLETSLIGVYLIVLIVFYIQDGKQSKEK